MQIVNQPSICCRLWLGDRRTCITELILNYVFRQISNINKKSFININIDAFCNTLSYTHFCEMLRQNKDYVSAYNVHEWNNNVIFRVFKQQAFSEYCLYNTCPLPSPLILKQLLFYALKKSEDNSVKDFFKKTTLISIEKQVVQNQLYYLWDAFG